LKKQIILTEQTHEKVLQDVKKEKKLKKGQEAAAAKLPTVDEIKAEKEADLHDKRVGAVLNEVPKQRKLKKAATTDKSQLPGKDEVLAQIKAEKEAEAPSS